MPETFPLRYVVLRHEEVAEPHFDLLFETRPESPLAAWRSTQWPLTSTARLTPLPDHRRVYLEYEGPISGNRGVVRRVAAGTHQVLPMERGAFIVQLDSGQILHLPLEA